MITPAFKPSSSVGAIAPVGRVPAVVGAEGQGAVGATIFWVAKAFSMPTLSMVRTVVWTVSHPVLSFKPSKNIVSIRVEQEEKRS